MNVYGNLFKWSIEIYMNQNSHGDLLTDKCEHNLHLFAFHALTINGMHSYVYLSNAGK